MLRLKRFNYIIVLLIVILIKFDLLAVWSDTIPGTTLKPSRVPIFGEFEIVPDKGVYEENEIINLDISLRIDREHVSYEPDKIYDIRTSYVTGFESIYGTFEIISSNIDTLFTMDEQNDLVNINTIIQTKKRTNRVGIELDIYRVGFNEGVHDQIVYGQIPENNPEVQWQLNHDRYQKRAFFNTSIVLQKRGAFNLPQLDINREYFNLMKFSKLYLYEEDSYGNMLTFTEVSVVNEDDDNPAFYTEDAHWPYFPHLDHDDELAVVHSQVHGSSPGTPVQGQVIYSYYNEYGFLVEDVEWDFRIINDVNLTFQIRYEERIEIIDEEENVILKAPIGNLKLFMCNDINWDNCYEYNPAWLINEYPVYDENLSPYGGSNYSQINIYNFSAGFMGFKIEFYDYLDLDFLTLLELPENAPINAPMSDLIDKSFWVTIFHPELYYTEEYLNEGEFEIVFLNDEYDNSNENSIITLHHKDLCGAMHVMRQVERVEDFSNNSLEINPRVQPLYIFSQFDQDWTNPEILYQNYPGLTAYCAHPSIPESYFGDQFIYLHGSRSENDPQTFHQWANSIILHELGHAYHQLDDCTSYTFGDQEGWEYPADNTYGPYNEAVAHTFSSMIRTLDTYESVYDHCYDVFETYIPIMDEWKFGYNYFGNSKISSWSYLARSLEIPHGAEEFYEALPNANQYEGAIAATLWDLFDDIDEGETYHPESEILTNYDYICNTDDISPFWYNIVRSEDVVDFGHNYITYYDLSEENIEIFKFLAEAHNIIYTTRITHDTLWDEQEIIINNQVIIEEDIVLTISEDVNVVFLGTSELINLGHLVIQDNVCFYGQNLKNILKSEGDITFGSNVCFLPLNNEHWAGLNLDSCEPVYLYNVTFENCNLKSKETDVNIIGGQFINSQIKHYKFDLIIDGVQFENTSIYANTPGTEDPTEILSINNCSFQDQDALTDIFISGYPNYEIIDNEIFSNGQNCIYIYEAGLGKNHVIHDNYIESNDNSCGILLYHSYADITGSNEIQNNLTGINGSHNSNIILQGNETGEYQTIHHNLEDEVVFTHDSFPVIFHFNIIEDDNHRCNYVKCIDHVAPCVHKITENNWGRDFQPLLDLEPNDAYNYEPIWEPRGRDGEIGEDEILYFSAKQNFENEEYELAEQTFKDIISLYSESEFAKASAKELLALEQYLNNDYLELQNYYENEPNMYYDEEMTDLAYYLINYCNIKLGEYPTAIEWFESIIMDPPSEQDSIFAVIDAGYTYLLMEEEDRHDYVGKMPELKPASQKEFDDKRDRLLAYLFGFPYFDDDIADDIIPKTITLEQNYPNPFNPNTTISFSIPEDSKVNLSIYNIKGQKVKTLAENKFEKGLHKLIWDSKDSNDKRVSSGIYFYKLEADDHQKIRKMVLLK